MGKYKSITFPIEGDHRMYIIPFEFGSLYSLHNPIESYERKTNLQVELRARGTCMMHDKSIMLDWLSRALLLYARFVTCKVCHWVKEKRRTKTPQNLDKCKTTDAPSVKPPIPLISVTHVSSACLQRCKEENSRGHISDSEVICTHSNADSERRPEC